MFVAADRSTFQSKHPSVLNLVGDWDGFLSNSGEELVLEDERGREVDRVAYSDDGDWGVRGKGPLNSLADFLQETPFRVAAPGQRFLETNFEFLFAEEQSEI